MRKEITEKEYLKKIIQNEKLREMIKHFKPTNHIPEDTIIVTSRVVDHGDTVIKNSAITQCSYCNEDVFVAPSTQNLLPQDRAVTFMCNMCLLNEIQNRNHSKKS